MLSLQFNDLINSKNNNKFTKAVFDYCSLSKSVRPTKSYYQIKFSNFYKLNNSCWKSPIMNQLFFDVFSAFDQMKKKHIKVTYAMILIMLSEISGMTEKSFASKILHTLYESKPIIDKKVIDKLNKESVSEFIETTQCRVPVSSSYVYSIDSAIELYKRFETYYTCLSADPNTKKYIKEFDLWLEKQGYSKSSISDTKKIDFWMWLA